MRFLKKSLRGSILYYVSEIIIVIAGIFIAIQLNNWNEIRKDKQEEKKSYHRILSNLKTEKDVMKQYKQIFTQNKKQLIDIAYNNKMDNLDSIFNYFQAFYHIKMNSEYISLKYSGKLSLIKNDTIRTNLVNYYEFYYKKYDIISKRHTKMIDEGVIEYLRKEMPTDTMDLANPKLIKIQLKDVQFRNYIIEQINALKGINEQLEVGKLDQLIKEIEKEVEK